MQDVIDKWFKFTEEQPEHGRLVIIYTAYCMYEGYSVVDFDSYRDFQEINRCCSCDIRNEHILYWCYLKEVNGFELEENK